VFAESFLQNGDYDGGIALFNGRLELAGLLDRDRQRFHRQLILLYWYADRNQEAVASCQTAFRMAIEFGAREEAASLKEHSNCWSSTAAIDLRAEDDIAGSDRTFEKARAMARSIKSPAHELKVLRAWSSNYLGSGAIPKGYLDLNIRARDLAGSLGYKLEACRAENNLGTYYHAKGSLSYALIHYLRAYSHIRDLKANDNTLNA
jgi:hypothetical protein